ncbi:MAG: hypothetical protein HKP12_14595 [Gammaproteobacteria bacterium]|jgi:hypothetical protein|nr:hypothetical protein [Gammaproteobacteria bacterium]
MIERNVYNKGQLIVTRLSGKVHGQEIFDHLFWLIDSHNIGEVKSNYDQVVYAEDIESITIDEADVHRIMEVSTGLGQARGRFRTAIVGVEPFGVKLAQLYQSLSQDAEREVELCDDLASAFAWLRYENPDPEKYR